MWKERLYDLHLPKLLEFANGTPVQDKGDWEKRREEILDLLCREEYGQRPETPAKVSAVVEEENDRACAGKVLQQRILLSMEVQGKPFSFPLQVCVPKKVAKPMTIIYLAFRRDVPDRYLPLEEITDEGFAVATFCYQDIAADRDDDFTGGLAGLLKKKGHRPKEDTGKLMMWAFAASRVLDYLETRKDIDLRNVGVMGHSRLGKTALVAAAYDQRFAFCFPNDAGCSGDAISRGKEGERIERITDHFPYWFCPNYSKYAGREEQMPFDQHFLVAAIAPRYVCAGTAVEDTWADPMSQYLSYAAADEVYRFLGREGFVHPDRMPQAGDTFQEGTIGFHLRPGTHFHSRYDWRQYMEFMKKHRVEDPEI